MFFAHRQAGQPAYAQKTPVKRRFTPFFLPHRQAGQPVLRLTGLPAYRRKRLLTGLPAYGAKRLSELVATPADEAITLAM